MIVEEGRRSMELKSEWLPLDLCRERAGGARLLITREILTRFGQLLEWWPVMVEAAKMLQEQGITMAKPVNEI
jgi:hypothetical protein